MNNIFKESYNLVVRRYAVVLLSILLAITFMGCDSKPEYLNPNTWDADPKDYSKIVIVSGEGAQLKVEDSEIIEEIVGDVLGKSYTKETKNKTDGFMYSLIFFDVDGYECLKLAILSESSICYDGYVYKTDTEINIAYFNELFISTE